MKICTYVNPYFGDSHWTPQSVYVYSYNPTLRCMNHIHANMHTCKSISIRIPSRVFQQGWHIGQLFFTHSLYLKFLFSSFPSIGGQVHSILLRGIFFLNITYVTILMIVEHSHFLSPKVKYQCLCIHGKQAPKLLQFLIQHEPHISISGLNIITRTSSQSIAEKQVSGIAIQETFRALIDYMRVTDSMRKTEFSLGAEPLPRGEVQEYVKFR